jgi:hypothetical protein
MKYGIVEGLSLRLLNRGGILFRLKKLTVDLTGSEAKHATSGEMNLELIPLQIMKAANQ